MQKLVSVLTLEAKWDSKASDPGGQQLCGSSYDGNHCHAARISRRLHLHLTLCFRGGPCGKNFTNTASTYYHTPFRSIVLCSHKSSGDFNGSYARDMPRAHLLSTYATNRVVRSVAHHQYLHIINTYTSSYTKNHQARIYTHLSILAAFLCYI